MCEMNDNLLPWLFEESESVGKVRVNRLEMTEERIVRRVYALGRVVNSVMEGEGLLFWSCGGTTLGMIRHGGLIPWDDDLDICIREQDELQFTRLATQFAKEGYGIEKSNSYVWKIFHLTDSEEIEDKVGNYRYPACDVFIMKMRKDKFVIRDKSGQTTWPNEFYYEHQVKGITSRQFGDFQLPCPGTPGDYLARTYGDNWNTIGATHFLSHNTADIMQSTTFQMEKSFYKPALPFY